MKLVVIGAVVLTSAFAILLVFRYTMINRQTRAQTREPLSVNDPDFNRDAELMKYTILRSRRDIREARWLKKHDSAIRSDLVDEAWVADIFYHPSRLRIAGLVVTRQLLRKGTESEEGIWEYRSSCIVGIRNSTTEPYSFWELNIIFNSDMVSLESAIVGIRTSYFYLLKSHSISVGLTRGLQSSGKLGFGINDPAFWDSILWQKNVRHPDLYPFQVRKGFRSTEDIWIPIKPLVEEYPPWILDMYRE